VPLREKIPAKNRTEDRAPRSTIHDPRAEDSAGQSGIPAPAFHIPAVESPSRPWLKEALLSVS